tara:strand:- start:37 stop:1650 length:1614 start_codon:yes stop_codon:yes gene_type:complete
MRSDFKSVKETLSGFDNKTDYFDISRAYQINNYMKNLRTESKKCVMPLIDFVLRYMVVFTDKKTNKVIPFDESMLENPRVLGDNYKIKKRKTRWKANRNKIWKPKDSIRLYNGLISNYVDAALVLFDVKASIKLAEKKSSQSLKEWEDRLKEGFEYLPCDGTHKMDEYTEALIEYNYFSQDSENEEQLPLFIAMEKTTHFVSIKTSAHIDSWSENYLYSTYGVKPSDAAIRTGIIGELRDEIKKVCDNALYEVMEVIRGVMRNVHGDEQMLAEWSYWWKTSESPGSTSKGDELTDWYIHGRKLDSKSKNSIKKIVKYTELFKKYAHPTKTLFPKGAWWMWLMVCKSLEEEKIKVKEDKWVTVVQGFVVIWKKMYNDETPMTIEGDSTKKSTRLFKDFIGGLTTGFYGWFNGEFKDSMVDALVETCGLIKLDPKRSFTEKDRWKIITNVTVKKDGTEKVRIRINGEINGEWYDSKTKNIPYKYVSVCEALTRTDLYESDHKDIPHSEGGRTNWEDGELTTREYNNWKSNKMKKNKKNS